MDNTTNTNSGRFAVSGIHHASHPDARTNIQPIKDNQVFYCKNNSPIMRKAKEQSCEVMRLCTKPKTRTLLDVPAVIEYSTQNSPTQISPAQPSPLFTF